MDQNVKELVEAIEDALIEAYKYNDLFKSNQKIVESLEQVKAAISKVKGN